MIAAIVPQTGFGLTATKLEARLVSDDLHSSATFYYALRQEDGSLVKEGNCSIDGEDYGNWDGDNTTAVEACAAAAGVELAPEVPAPEEPAPTEEVPTQP